MRRADYYQCSAGAISRRLSQVQLAAIRTDVWLLLSVTCELGWCWLIRMAPLRSRHTRQRRFEYRDVIGAGAIAQVFDLFIFVAFPERL